MATRNILAAAAVAVAALGGVSSANAAVISVQYLTASQHPITAGTAGIVSEAPADWNKESTAGFSGSATIQDDSTVPNDYGLTWSSGGGWYTESFGAPNDSDANSQLMYNAISPGGPNHGNVSTTFTVSGLSSGNYNVYVYLMGLDATGDQQEVSIGSTTYYEKYTMASEWSVAGPPYTFAGFQDVDGNSSPTNYEEGNYVEFTNVAGPSITFNSIDTGGQAGVSGFQIQSVPEPTSLALAGLGSIGLLARRRRRIG